MQSVRIPQRLETRNAFRKFRDGVAVQSELLELGEADGLRGVAHFELGQAVPRHVERGEAAVP
jgi:hypothetical protein